jgi:hypothetical protein
MSGGSWPVLSALDARVLRATDARYERSPERIGGLAGCAADVALSALRRLRIAYLVADDGCRPQRGGFVPTGGMSRWSMRRDSAGGCALWEAGARRGWWTTCRATCRGSARRSGEWRPVRGAGCRGNGGDRGRTARPGDRDRDGRSGGGVGDAAAGAPAAGGVAARAAGGGGAR